MDTAPDSQLEGPPVSDSMPASTSCAAACRTLLGGCFEPIERDVLAACREDCEVSGLGGFDVECLAELECETSVEICAGDEAQ